MDQVNQLKSMRDEAWVRVKATPDYKLATSLDSLISDLESALGGDAGKSSVRAKAEPSQDEPEPSQEEVVETAPAAESANGASAQEKAEAEARQIEDDVMSELTQMIHAGIGGDAAEETEAAVDDEPAQEKPGKGDSKSEDAEAIEQDAILRAMKALDEDLSSDLELVSDSEGEAKQTQARKR